MANPLFFGAGTIGRGVRDSQVGQRRAAAGVCAMPALLVALVVLSACASLSEEECLAADWYAIGIEDGSRGQALSRLGTHRKACADYGVAPDADLYAQGRMRGLETFCTRERGYYQGEKGYTYNGVCPAHLEGLFMQGYLAGQEVYKTKKEIRRLQVELAKIDEEIGTVRENLDQGYVVDKSGKKHQLNKFERDALYERLLALGREKGRLEGEIATLRQSLSGA